MPVVRRWKGLPVPFFFQADTAEAFAALETRDDDVVMSSLVKGGTTWTHTLLFLLLHGMGDDGTLAAGAESSLGSKGQVYPEALVLRQGAPADPENPEHMNAGELSGHGPCFQHPPTPTDAHRRPPAPTKVREKFFGTAGFEDELCAQASPRLFSTHLSGPHLPAKLLAPDGKGRLVIVLRNMKDTLTSLHFFRGEPKDGWLGNEEGPGSLARFIHPDCPNAYGRCAINGAREARVRRRRCCRRRRHRRRRRDRQQQ